MNTIEVELRIGCTKHWLQVQPQTRLTELYSMIQRILQRSNFDLIVNKHKVDIKGIRSHDTIYQFIPDINHIIVYVIFRIEAAKMYINKKTIRVTDNDINLHIETIQKKVTQLFNPQYIQNIKWFKQHCVDYDREQLYIERLNEVQQYILQLQQEIHKFQLLDLSKQQKFMMKSQLLILNDLKKMIFELKK